MKISTKKFLSDINFYTFFHDRRQNIKDIKSDKFDFFEFGDREPVAPTEFQPFLNTGGKFSTLKLHFSIAGLDEDQNVKSTLANAKINFDDFKFKFHQLLEVHKGLDKDKIFVNVLPLFGGHFDISFGGLDVKNKLSTLFLKQPSIKNYRKRYFSRRFRFSNKRIKRSKFLHISEAVKLFLLCSKEVQLKQFLGFIRTLRLFIVS